MSSSNMSPAEHRTDFPRKEQIKDAVGILLHPSLEFSDVPIKVKSEYPHETALHSSKNSLSRSSCKHVLAGKVKEEISCDFDESLDTILLSERRRMLLIRIGNQCSRPAGEGNCGGLLTSVPQVVQLSAQIEVQNYCCAGEFLQSGRLCPVTSNYDVTKTSDSALAGMSFPIRKGSPPMSCDIVSVESIESRASSTFQESKSCGRPDPQTTYADTMGSSALSSLTRVKDEPVDSNELCNEEKKCWNDSYLNSLVPVKNETEFSGAFGDEIDHMSLIDRIKLLPSGISSNLCGPFKSSLLDIAVDVLESVKPIRISRPTKRRRTATNSAQVALEEDAPELLKVLIERGVSIGEVKLYGEDECNDPIDDSLCDGSLLELESVVSKLFWQRQSLLKFAPIHCSKGSRASYCLASLLSLVEQTRYMQNRKWPVEWGWCRDLQSFIFVFERHNRIVLERPEYGCATYFFELLDSLPIDWQIRRLVTTMKLTSCGRVTLIENKPLVVGEDLSEGEARVLRGYGWIPNTGLGTMLNYCDRVIHDRRNETDSSEWRSKIARLLINGYNGGIIISKDIPEKLAECQSMQSPQVKLEL